MEMRGASFAFSQRILLRINHFTGLRIDYGAFRAFGGLKFSALLAFSGRLAAFSGFCGPVCRRFRDSCFFSAAGICSGFFHCCRSFCRRFFHGLLDFFGGSGFYCSLSVIRNRSGRCEIAG